MNFSFYWNSTRVFKENLFAEFPIWSFTFGDFHPHVMNYPSTVVFLTFVLSFEKFQKISLKNLVFIVLLGTSLTMVNIWEGIFLTFLCSIFYFWSLSENNVSNSYKKMVLNPLLSSFVGVLSILPWLKSLLINSGTAGEFAVNRAPSNGVKEYFLFFGVILLIYIFSAMILVYKKTLLFDRRRIFSKIWLAFIYLPVFSLGIMNPNIESKILTFFL